jgi:hypothetical protein
LIFREQSVQHADEPGDDYDQQRPFGGNFSHQRSFRIHCNLSHCGVYECRLF